MEKFTIYDEVTDSGLKCSPKEFSHELFNELIQGELPHPIEIFKLRDIIGFNYLNRRENKRYWYTEQTDLTNYDDIVDRLKEEALELFKKLA